MIRLQSHHAQYYYHPVASQDVESRFGEGDVTIFSPFTPMNVDTHPGSVEIGNLKKQRFMESEPTGVDGGQIGLVLRSVHRIEETSNFF